ncbi:MAG: sigma-70 family RNA polymerase sigma factor [Bacteroidota bacterium]
MDKQQLQHASDDDLVRYFQETGNREYVGVLYQRNAHLIYGACLKYLENREESKDAVMAIFEKIILKMPDASIHKFNTWLFSVVKNECLSRLRKRKSTLRQEEIFQQSEKSEDQFMENEGVLRLYNKEEAETKEERLAEAMNQLQAIQRRCIELFFFEDRTYAEIAQETNLPLKQVKSHLQNGKRLLKRYFEAS